MAKSELNCVSLETYSALLTRSRQAARAGSRSPVLGGRLPDQTFEAAIIAAGAAQFGELCGTFGLIYRPRGRAYAPATELF